MEFGAEFVVMVRTNTKGFCKEIVENITKDQTGGSYLVLRIKPMVPGRRLIIAIGYMYNEWKVLSFIVTDNSGGTQIGLPYLSKCSDKFTNVPIFPIARPLVMSKFFLLLMRLTPTTNQGILICHQRSSGVLSVVECGYVRQFIWELLLLMVGNCVVMGLRYNNMKN